MCNAVHGMGCLVYGAGVLIMVVQKRVWIELLNSSLKWAIFKDNGSTMMCVILEKGGF